MSLDATRWAWQQMTKNSTDKLVLLSLADRADERHHCYPSIERLRLDTQCDRKTVMEAIRRLEESGLIVATKAWGKGTHYQLLGVGDRHTKPVPKTVPVPKTGLVPKTDTTSPKNGTGPVPKTGHEPINNQSRTENKGNARSALDLSRLPESVSEGIWQQFTGHRKAIKKPLTQEAVNRIGNELHRIEAAGISPDEAIGEALERGWVSVKLSWLENTHAKGTRPGNGNGASRARRVADTLDGIIRDGLPEERTERVGGGDLSEAAGDLRRTLDGEYRRH
jgi:hypothetical protein